MKNAPRQNSGVGMSCAACSARVEKSVAALGEGDSLISLCRSLEKLDVDQLKEKVEQVQKYLTDMANAHGSVTQFLSNVADTVTEFVNKAIDFVKGIFA